MKKFIYVLLILPLFFSCAKNGEYKKCNDYFESLNKEEGYWDGMAEIIMKENPNSEVCRIENYKDDIIISTKYYVDNKLIFESKRTSAYSGPDGERIRYNKKGDTTDHRNVTEEYTYNLSQSVNGKGENLGYSIQVDYKNRADISELYYEYDKDDRLILRKTHCRDKKGNFCKCPNDKNDKFLTKFHNERALEKQKRNANTNFLGRP